MGVEEVWYDGWKAAVEALETRLDLVYSEKPRNIDDFFLDLKSELKELKSHSVDLTLEQD